MIKVFCRNCDKELYPSTQRMVWCCPGCEYEMKDSKAKEIIKQKRKNRNTARLLGYSWKKYGL